MFKAPAEKGAKNWKIWSYQSDIRSIFNLAIYFIAYLSWIIHFLAILVLLTTFDSCFFFPDWKKSFNWKKTFNLRKSLYWRNSGMSDTPIFDYTLWQTWTNLGSNAFQGNYVTCYDISHGCKWKQRAVIKCLYQVGIKQCEIVDR